MKLEELRKSGLLELYAIGDLSPADQAEVEAHLKASAELREELRNIENALLHYADVNAVDPRPELKKILMDNVLGTQNSKPASDQQNGKSTGKNNHLLGLGIAGLVALGALYWGWNSLQRMQATEQALALLQSQCDSIAQTNDATLALYQQLYTPGSNVLAINPTEKYPNTSLFLYLNERDGTNYLQSINLPQITAQQVFQLWSLKGSEAPIPLSTFNDDDGLPQQVDFEAGTNTYAITIEPAGGSQTPNLDDLVGTIAVG